MSFRAVLKGVLLFFVVLMPFAAIAQEPGGGTVHGSIVDPDKAVIPGTTVTLTPASGKALITKSQSDGTYVLHDVPAGTYALTATMRGFASFVRQGLKITAGQALAFDIKMEIEEQQQQVNVTAEGAEVSVDPDSNASATVIKGKDLDALSDDPDELSSELTALAGPAAGPNGGQIYVDGFTGGQLPPKSSIREIRINQNPFSAEYDKLGYGRVEVFTKPGTDKYHGNLNVQGGDNVFNTSNPFLGASNTQPPYHTVFILGNVSGPINHLTSFTVSGSHRTIQNNNIVNPSGFYAASSTSTIPCQPGNLSCLYFTTIPESARAVSNPQTRSDISPRLDFALGEKNTLTVRYQYYVNGQQNVGVGNTNLASAGYNTDTNENTIQISDTQIISSRVINETRFEYQRDDTTQNPLSTDPTLSVQGIFTYGGSSLGTQTSLSTHIEVQNYTSIALAKNFIRFGGRLRTTGESLYSDAGSNGTFTYSYLLDPCTDSNPSIKKPSNCAANVTTPCSPLNASISSYQCGLPGQFAFTKINQAEVYGRETDVEFYAEDDWKPKSNLTISYGLRLEAQNIIDSAHDLAPRVSFAYGIPRGGGKASTTVVRGGYGIFYDRFTLANYLITLQENGVNQITSTFINPGATCTPADPIGCGTSSTNQITTYGLGEGIRSSYTMQAAIGVDQQIGRAATLSVNYLNARGDHQYLSRNFVVSTGFDQQFQSGAVYRENQLLVNGNARLRKVTLFGFYSLNLADANTSGAGFFPTSNTDTKVDYGKASFTHDSFAVIGGSIQLPYQFNASPFIIAQSGTPYNLTTGLDPSGSSIYNQRPFFTNGNSGSCTSSASFSSTQTGDLTSVPINYCTGPINSTFNLRVSRVFGFGQKTVAAANGSSQSNNGGGSGGGRGGSTAARAGGPGGVHGGFGPGPSSNSGHRYTFTLGAQAFNLFNVVNFGTPTSTLSSPRFGEFTTLAGGPFSSSTAVRRITLQTTFNF
jgi:hypothetical protein